MPSVVDFATGRVRASVNVPLADIALRDVLRERLGIPVVVDNDATCAALAEAYDDDGALVARHLVMFTVGTGVGGGIVIDGRIYRGATGAAAELGHTIIGADLRSTPFAHADDFPRPARSSRSPPAACSTSSARELGLPDASTRRGRRATVTRARCAAIDLLGRRLGVGIANAINTFDPDLVVVGGGVSRRGRAAARARPRGGRALRAGRRRHARRGSCQARYGAARRGPRRRAARRPGGAPEQEAGVP